MVIKHPNPGLKSTIWIDNSYISDMAHGFAEVALKMATSLGSDPHQPKRNVVYTNAILAIELYFKSKFAIRAIDPAHAFMSDERTMSLGTAEQIDSGDANIAIMHARLEMPKGKWTHNIHKLFNLLDEEFKGIILNNIKEEASSIKSMKELEDFIFEIKDYFVTKRYAFEFFIEAVPPDANYIYDLIPVLRGIMKTFGYREE